MTVYGVRSGDGEDGDYSVDVGKLLSYLDLDFFREEEEGTECGRGRHLRNRIEVSCMKQSWRRDSTVAIDRIGEG